MLPNNIAERRNRLAARFLAGDGIEIGALDAPLQMPADARVRYVDRVTVERLRQYYPELGARALVEPDVIDDGEALQRFEPESLDFIVANHMLEHCENPIGTVREHLVRLRRGGTLFYSVPDKRYSFDADRPITDFDHLLADAADHGRGSRSRHYDEWAVFVNKIGDPAAAERNARENERNAYSIHFHVWDEAAFLLFLNRLADRPETHFELRHFEQNDTEIVAVLRKPA